ncbi:MAG: alanine--glyoxylate aminotransferase family protein, partial [Deltaproteobacteria bacterium]|nr:alanine--glyoxylate aminotransferase family protein [Deltaproteobacteria bacterium]
MTPPARVLMGPGPSDVSPRVLEALSRPTVGHLDPYFLKVLDETQSMLREVLGTENALTLPISATGSAGMEACFVNLLEPGDRTLIGRNGVFGGRMAEVARRCGAEVTIVDAPWGRAIDPDDVARVAKHGSFKVLALVHAETSTGVLQDLSPFRAIADSCGALLVIDAVTSLGGVAVDVDRMGIDAVYSGTQKCLSCPPGLSPVSFSARAQSVLEHRKSPVQSWYLDLTLIGRYFGTERVYHHTAPVNMIYALHQSLRLVLEEGLDARYRRHRDQAQALWAGLEQLGIALLVDASVRLPPLTLARIPEGVDDRAVRAQLLADHGLEIGGGLGEFAGKAWRIGLMGASSTPRHVELCLGALEEA